MTTTKMTTSFLMMSSSHSEILWRFAQDGKPAHRPPSPRRSPPRRRHQNPYDPRSFSFVYRMFKFIYGVTSSRLLWQSQFASATTAVLFQTNGPSSPRLRILFVNSSDFSVSHYVSSSSSFFFLTSRVLRRWKRRKSSSSACGLHRSLSCPD